MINSIFNKPILLGICFILFHSISAQTQKSAPGEILAQIHQLNTTGKVLYVAAHPDDENTRLLSWLANDKHYQTAYLSLTRGDGGQNLIGNEQSEELGLIRTQELLAARRTDGAEQFFTRAFDFGFSKNPEETFRIWDKEKILHDVVLVIRKFKPDVIITRFPTTGEGGHGHHTASAILAVEAFEAAADPSRFPDQVKLYGTWKTKSLYWNNFKKWRDPNADVSAALKLDIGAYLPLLGESVGEISARSRSQHKSQGFGVALQRGEILEYFDHLAGEKAQIEPFEKLQEGWSDRAVTDSIQAIIQQFHFENPAMSVDALARLHAHLKKTPFLQQPTHHLQLLETILMNCIGFYGEFTAVDHFSNPGKRLNVSFNCINRSATPVKLISFKTDLPQALSNSTVKILAPNVLFSHKDTLQIPIDFLVSNPYWLAESHSEGLFTVNNLAQIGLPESYAPIQLEAELQIGVARFSTFFPLQYTWVDPVKGELRRRVEILPATTVSLNQDILILNQTDRRWLQITIETTADSLNTEVFLNIPDAFVCSPARIPVVLGKKSSNKQVLTFEISASPTRETKPDQRYDIQVNMGKGKEIITLQSISRIDYDHIPIQTWIRPAVVTAVYVNMIRKGQNLVYIPGAEDKVGACLKSAGYSVTEMRSDQVTADKLQNVDAVLMGIRAFNTNENMQNLMPVLFDYVEQGGTLIEQYNTKNWISDVKVQAGPYPFDISRERVTDENAPMKMLVTDHPVFNSPNIITPADFDGWVQERGLYFPEKWDKQYTALIECNDPGEKPLQGSLIVTEYGKGKFVYTGLSFFRELPAGVPGAYRLMANLIGWGNYEGN